MSSSILLLLLLFEGIEKYCRDDGLSLWEEKIGKKNIVEVISVERIIQWEGTERENLEFNEKRK